VLPHVPQFWPSAGTQAPLHTRPPPEQLQAPTMRAEVGAAQAWPQVPQFALSVSVSTQAPPHSLSVQPASAGSFCRRSLLYRIRLRPVLKQVAGTP